MNIQAKKLELIQLLIKTNDPQTIKALWSVLKNNEAKDYWLSLSEDQKEEINLGLKEVAKGDTMDYKDFMSKHRQ